MYTAAIGLVFFALLIPEFPAQTVTAEGKNPNSVKISSKSRAKTELRCPSPEQIPFEFFPLPCTGLTDCSLMGRGYVCCGLRGNPKWCTKGIRHKSRNSITDVKKQAIVQLVVPSATSAKTTTSTTTATTTTTTTTTTPVPTTTTTTTPRPTTTTMITPRPTITVKSAKAKRVKADIVCPNNIPFQFFSVRCVKKHSECQSSLGQDFLCCNQVCIRGVAAPLAEQSHQPILGILPHDCPSDPFGELLFETQTCETDAECWPRICCPDGNKRYCKMSLLRFDSVPATRRFNEPFSNVADYFQCSPPPPNGLDLFPRTCSNSLDCFPNLCCQEGGDKFCRPAKKSVLAAVAGGIGSNIPGFLQNQLRGGI